MPRPRFNTSKNPPKVSSRSIWRPFPHSSQSTQSLVSTVRTRVLEPLRRRSILITSITAATLSCLGITTSATDQSTEPSVHHRALRCGPFTTIATTIGPRPPSMSQQTNNSARSNLFPCFSKGGIFGFVSLVWVILLESFCVDDAFNRIHLVLNFADEPAIQRIVEYW